MSEAQASTPEVTVGSQIWTIKKSDVSHLDQENTYLEQYFHNESGNKFAALIKPEIPAKKLHEIVQASSYIEDHIDALKVNVDGTGHFFEAITGEESDVNDDEVEQLKAFFDEPWPGVSFMQMRKQLREDLEEVGRAYLEVIENMEGQIIMLKPLRASGMFVAKPGKPYMKEVTITRGGRELKATYPTIDRRYGYVVGKEVRYLREFNAGRHIDKESGEWLNSTPNFEKRGNRVIAFPGTEEVYPMPRWWHKLTSVLGAREAEELNLTFFDKGGVPPVIITLSGGALAEKSQQELTAMVTGKTKNKLSAAVLSAIPTTGGLDEKAPPVKMDVHKFGAEAQKDAMFEQYDRHCEEKIAGAYRIPPIFLGKAADYTYAAAHASYLVGEEQVFRPERKTFDDIINATVMREAEFFDGRYKYVSKNLESRNPEMQKEMLLEAHTRGVIDTEQFIEKMNELTGLDLTYDEALEEANNAPSSGEAGPVGAGGDPDSPEQIQKSIDLALDLRDRYLVAAGATGQAVDKSEMQAVLVERSKLSDQDQKLFDAYVAERLDVFDPTDPAGSIDLCCGAVELAAA